MSPRARICFGSSPQGCSLVVFFLDLATMASRPAGGVGPMGSMDPMGPPMAPMGAHGGKPE